MSRRLDPENFNAEKFAWHRLVAFAPGLSSGAKSLAGMILHDLNSVRGYAYRSQKGMDEASCVGDRQIRRQIKELQEAGFLKVETQLGRGKTNRYFAVIPDGIELFRPRDETTPKSAPKNRTSTSAIPAKNRTSMSKKADIDVRQYPYKSIRESRAPVRAPAMPSIKPTPVAARFSNPGIRQQVVSLIGPEKTASYLDSARWDATTRTIVTPHGYAADRLRELLGRYLSRERIAVSAGIMGPPLMAA